MQERKPNIILIYTDQQRFDTLGANGNPYIQTPNLDRLASEGVNFSHSFVNTPLCTPSRIAMFTGRYSHATLCYKNNVTIPDSEHDFASILRQHQYKTALIGKDHCFGSKRINVAFDYVRKAGHLGFGAPENETELEINQYRKDKMFAPYSDDPFAAESNITAKVFQWAQDYVAEQTENQDDKPFFMWLSVPDPHPPYMVSEPYASMYDDVALPMPVWREGEMNNKPYRQRAAVEWGALNQAYPTEAELLKLKRIYYGMISCIDTELGKLLALLKEKSLEENTIILFTSDHGDYLGDHHMFRKGPHLYDALTRVPLIIKWKGVIPPSRSEALVSNLDVFPALLDLAGVDVPSNVHGKSFAKVLLGQTDQHREHIFLEHGTAGKPLQKGDLSADQIAALMNSRNYHNHAVLMRGRSKAVRTKDWKYVLTPGDRDELYDLKLDPHELVNVAEQPENKEIVEQCRLALLEWLIEIGD